MIKLITQLMLWGGRLTWGFFCASDIRHLHLPKDLEHMLMYSYVGLMLWKLVRFHGKVKQEDDHQLTLVKFNRFFLSTITVACLLEYLPDTDFTDTNSVVKNGAYCLLKIGLFALGELTFDAFLTMQSTGRAFTRNSVWKQVNASFLTEPAKKLVYLPKVTPAKLVKVRVASTTVTKSRTTRAKTATAKTPAPAGLLPPKRPTTTLPALWQAFTQIGKIWNGVKN